MATTPYRQMVAAGILVPPSKDDERRAAIDVLGDIGYPSYMAERMLDEKLRERAESRLEDDEPGGDQAAPYEEV